MTGLSSELKELGLDNTQILYTYTKTGEQTYKKILRKIHYLKINLKEYSTVKTKIVKGVTIISLVLCSIQLNQLYLA